MKLITKRLVHWIATIAISPLLLTDAVSRILIGSDASLESHSQFLSLIPGMIGNRLRVAFYCRTLQSCDFTATVCFGSLLSKRSAVIGRHVYIGPRCMLGCVTLEDDVLLGPAVQVPSGPHTHGVDSLDVPIRSQPGKLRRVVVGRDSWIGGGSIVLADVRPHCVVGAGSVVTKEYPGESILVGSPAKRIQSRQPTQESVSTDQQSCERADS